jgi:hypothetical protein
MSTGWHPMHRTEAWQEGFWLGLLLGAALGALGACVLLEALGRLRGP